MSRPAFLLLASAALLAASAPGPGRAATGIPYHDLVPQRRVVALTPGVEGDALAGLLDRLEAEGVTIPVAVPDVGLMVLERPGLDAILAREGVTRVLRGPTSAAERAASDPRAAGLLDWWDEGFVAPELPPPGARTPDVQLCAGAKTLDAALAARGQARCGPVEYGSVHFAAGRCVANLILPESVGPASLYDWNPADVTKVTSEFVRALGWWSLKSQYALTFVLFDHGTVPTDEEPANLSSADEGLYIQDCLTNLGYTETNCPYGQVAELNEATRVQARADWSFTQFILDADTFPGSSALAYAYLGGPITVALRGNGSLGIEYLDRVIAHEMGHIFQAADEYLNGCSCGGRYGYLDVENLNCVSCLVPEGKCVMRGSTEYSPAEMQNMEQAISPCTYTRQMAGIWDDPGDADTIWEVRETHPQTVFTSVVPETLETPQNFRVQGRSTDIPYPAPLRYPNPVTVNRIQRVDFWVDGGAHRQAQALDGAFDETDEAWELALPELGGGTHTLHVSAVNSVFWEDRSAPQISFVVHDVKLREDLYASPEDGAIAVTWTVDGEDFGSTYSVFRTRPGSGAEELLATVPSKRGKDDRFVYWDRSVKAGTEYVYRLAVDIPDKGQKELGLARAEATLRAPPPGSFVAVAPNPSPAGILLSVSVPRGPRPSKGDVLIPGEGGAAGFRADGPGGDTGGGGSSAPPLWRDVRIAIYDISGRLVRDLGTFRGLEDTSFNAAWDGRSETGAPVPAGVYFASVRLDYTRSMEKLVLVR